MEAVEIIEPNASLNEEICQLLIRSITKSCEMDHHNDPTLLKEWLANKTAENVSNWLAANRTYCAISETGSVLGVLQVSPRNEILLNYVDPGAQGNGIGRKLLQKLEEDLGKGSRITVESTKTAKPFYKRMGFKNYEGDSNEMSKQISL